MKKNGRSELLQALALCKGAFMSAAGFSMVINLLMIVPAIYMLQLYDRVVTTGNKSTLLMLTLIVVALFCTMSFLEWVRSQILVRVSAKLETLLNQRVFSVAYKQSLYTGGQRASSQALDDLTALRQFLTGNGLFAFFDAPWLPIYIALLFLFHSWYGWFSVITAILLILIAIANEKATVKTMAEANKLTVVGRGQVGRNLRNAEIIESMGMLDNVRRRWLNTAEQVLLFQSKASFRSGLLTATSKVVRITAQSMILGLGAYLVIERELTPGLMIAGSILLGRALAPLDLMIATWKGFINARDQYQRLNTLLSQIPADTEKMPLPEPKGVIKFEAVTVAPPGAKLAVLKNINLTIERGDMIGVVGPSGAGNSSFARALLGIWPAANGNVRLDGAEISHWDRQALGPFVGYLPQDVELFDGTVSENIARFGEIVPEQIIDAAQMADVHELILRLPQGYDTVIGSVGGVLSGGQRQRIGLARALYGNPVVVVLDEPNSNLDEQGELALSNTLQRLQQRKTTVILITHKQPVLAKVNKLLVLNEGQAMIYGPREQVIAQLQQQAAQFQKTRSHS